MYDLSMLFHQAVLPLVFYFLFNFAFFRFVSHQTGIKVSWIKTNLLFFAINWAAFMVFSGLSLNLIINWSLVIVLFVVEIRFGYRIPWSQALVYALTGAAVGLAINIFARSFFSILLDVPQSRFNGDLNSIEPNLKAIPISVGFAGSALAFVALDSFYNKQEFSVICNNQRSLAFFLIMSVCAFGYLCTVLLIYYLPSNEALLKLWGLKAALSSVIIQGLAFYFSYRSAYLIQCGEESRLLSETLEEHRKLNETLHTIAIRDSLTDCYTRTHLEEMLTKQIEQATEPFGIAFVDVDNLKHVNDTYGHDAGNDYIVSVANVLTDFCHDTRGDYVGRYGGDEFIMVFPQMSQSQVDLRLEEISHRLRTENESNRMPFTLSVSCGSTEVQPGEQTIDAISRADAAMYEDKQRRAAGR